MDIDIKEIIKTVTESLDLSKFNGDVVGVKIVENEIGKVEEGGIGVCKIYESTDKSNIRHKIEDNRLLDLDFFDSEKFRTIKGQVKLRVLLNDILPQINVDSGRDWIAVYIAYHFFMNKVTLMKNFSTFFSDIEALLPNTLNKIKEDQTGDKRYKSYTEALSNECDKWFINSGCLPPQNEWKSRDYLYTVDDNRRRLIQNIVTELYKGMNEI